MLFNLSPPLEGEAVAKRRQGAVLFAPQKKSPLRFHKDDSFCCQEGGQNTLPGLMVNVKNPTAL